MRINDDEDDNVNSIVAKSYTGARVTIPPVLIVQTPGDPLSARKANRVSDPITFEYHVSTIYSGSPDGDYTRGMLCRSVAYLVVGVRAKVRIPVSSK